MFYQFQQDHKNIDFGRSTAKEQLKTKRDYDELEKRFIRRFKNHLPTLYKLKTDPKYGNFYTQTSGGVSGVMTDISSENYTGGATLANGVSGLWDPISRRIDPKGFKDQQLKLIDSAEEELMLKKGGKFLDRT